MTVFITLSYEGTSAIGAQCAAVARKLRRTTEGGT
ncbi:MAG: hypothetical protein LZF62_410170 [Nitrospira sp.]|nr:MAG: hypothetical protein LZF62_410170 [Nitrospira sp.]